MLGSIRISQHGFSNEPERKIGLWEASWKPTDTPTPTPPPKDLKNYSCGGHLPLSAPTALGGWFQPGKDVLHHSTCKPDTCLTPFLLPATGVTGYGLVTECVRGSDLRSLGCRTLAICCWSPFSSLLEMCSDFTDNTTQIKLWSSEAQIMAKSMGLSE